MMFMWSRIERSARSFSPMVLRRIMRIWVNRFSARSISTALWLSRMMVWWNSILTSEYSSRCARSLPFSNVANIRRRPAISAIARVLRDQPRRHALKRRPGGDHLDHLALGLAHHIDAAARHRAHEAFALELRHRLTHRRAADAEVVRQLALVKADVVAAAIDVHRHDGVLQRGVGLVLEARGDVDGGQRRLRCRRRANRGGRARTQTDAAGANRLGLLMTGIQYARCEPAAQPACEQRASAPISEEKPPAGSSRGRLII